MFCKYNNQIHIYIYINVLFITGSFVTISAADAPCGHRLELPFHLVDQNREVFKRKSSFVVIFFLAGDLV